MLQNNLDDTRKYQPEDNNDKVYSIYHMHYICNTFTPQIKEIAEDIFAMHTSTQGD